MDEHVWDATGASCPHNASGSSGQRATGSDLVPLELQSPGIRGYAGPADGNEAGTHGGGRVGVEPGGGRTVTEEAEHNHEKALCKHGAGLCEARHNQPEGARVIRVGRGPPLGRGIGYVYAEHDRGPRADWVLIMHTGSHHKGCWGGGS